MPLDEEGVQRAMAAIVTTWLAPELRRRIEEDRLPDGFKLKAYQLVTDAEGIVREVRLNEEVRAAVRVRRPREIAKDDIVIGDPSAAGPFEILLTDADPNAGHITAIQTGNGWMTSIDLRSNARRAAEHAKAARQFLDAAAAALAQNNMRPFVQNLLDATELMAKAYLLTKPEGYTAGKTHRAVAGPFNLERAAGNVAEPFSKLLNDLSDLRGSARYLEGDFALQSAQANRMMATAELMYRTLHDVVPKRHAVDS